MTNQRFNQILHHAVEYKNSAEKIIKRVIAEYVFAIVDVYSRQLTCLDVCCRQLSDNRLANSRAGLDLRGKQENWGQATKGSTTIASFFWAASSGRKGYGF